ncbi:MULTISPECIES: helicase associated domain-containing protein [Nocardiaceae]|nr:MULTISPECIES: helicase associated domain-containing protein [Nocardiaceae]
MPLWVTSRRVDRRHSRQSLTPDRITELDSLGFDWGTTRTKK